MMHAEQIVKYGGDWIDIKISNHTFSFREIISGEEIKYTFCHDLFSESSPDNFGFGCDSYTIFYVFFEFIQKTGLGWKRVK